MTTAEELQREGDAGRRVPFLAGTDIGNPFVYPGQEHPRRARTFRRSGSHARPLRTATLNPAVYLSATDSLGVVEPGAVASLVLLGGNPLDDIEHVRDVVAVVQHGRAFDTSHGDPSDPEAFAWLYGWSPLHRIEDGACYPATLVATASNDVVVHPSQSYKFAARLQAAQGCDAPTLLRVHPTGGHSVWSDLETRADVLAFAARHTGLDVPNQQARERS